MSDVRHASTAALHVLQFEVHVGVQPFPARCAVDGRPPTADRLQCQFHLGRHRGSSWTGAERSSRCRCVPRRTWTSAAAAWVLLLAVEVGTSPSSSPFSPPAAAERPGAGAAPAAAGGRGPWCDRGRWRRPRPVVVGDLCRPGGLRHRGVERRRRPQGGAGFARTLGAIPRAGHRDGDHQVRQVIYRELVRYLWRV